RNRFDGHVVGGRAESARGDHRTRAIECLTERLHNDADIIATRGVARDGYSETCELAAEEAAVRIDGEAKQELVTDCYDFDVQLQDRSIVRCVARSPFGAAYSSACLAREDARVLPHVEPQ